MSDSRFWRNVTIIFFAVNCIILIFLAEGRFLYHKKTLAEEIKWYEKTRAELLEREFYGQLGGRSLLNHRELEANEVIMMEKQSEYYEGFRNATLFKPAQHFFKVREQISKTPLFNLLKTMPKGGVLHTHDFALCSTKCLIELTYREHLWICVAGASDGSRNESESKKAENTSKTETNSVAGFEASNADGSYELLRFTREKPPNNIARGCEWLLLSELRKVQGADEIDSKLSERFTLKENLIGDVQEVWKEFSGVLRFVIGLLTYAPVWHDYYYHALQEFYDDGVQYLEIRSNLAKLYDLDGRNYTIEDTAFVMQSASTKFKAKHPDFIGTKIIYAPTRNVSDCTFHEILDNAIGLKQSFPDFLAGFDLISYEDAGRPLKDFSHSLMAVKHFIDFYFHAGETNWSGTTTDENLIDAILLGSKRIGHGLAVMKHPEVLRYIRRERIAIEISPISNQVLQFITDFRNHPAAFWFAENYPVVIASDNPSFWKATPSTHDFYIAFLGIASQSADIGMLKQLALNSIIYSAMNNKDQQEALKSWSKKWSNWINEVRAADDFI